MLERRLVQPARFGMNRREFMKLAGISGVVAGAGMLGFPRKARAEQVWHVNPSMITGDGNPAQINDVINTRAQPGDSVFFDEGTYQLGYDAPAHDYYEFNLRVPNIIIDGAGSDRVILRGNDTSGGIIWRVYADGVELRNFRTENSQAGILFDNSINVHNVAARWLEMRDHDKHIIYPKQEDNQETITPAVIVENVYFRNPTGLRSNYGTGIHVNGQTNHSTSNTKYAGLANCTLDGLFIGTDAPFYWDDANQRWVVKGSNDFHDNLAMNGAWTYDQNLYQGFHTPDGHVEANNTEPSLYALGIQPQPPLTQNLEYTLAQLRLDSQGRPYKNSPLVGKQYRKGYCGAKPPVMIMAPPVRRLP